MKKLIIVTLIFITLIMLSGCNNSDSSEKLFKETRKQAEEFKKLSLTEKFNKLTNETTIIESRALLGAPAIAITSKLGEADLIVYIWKDKEGNEVGAAFTGARLMQKLDKEQIKYFKENSKEEDNKK